MQHSVNCVLACTKSQKNKQNTESPNVKEKTAAHKHNGILTPSKIQSEVTEVENHGPDEMR